MTKKIDILKELSNILIESLSSKESYKTGFQKYLLKFCNAYDTNLNKNSKPLFDLFKKLDNIEKTKINIWIKENTSIEGITVTKEGCKLTFKTGYDSLKVFNESLNWYDMKVEVKPFIPSDEKLKKSLENLIKKYNIEKIKAVLNTL